MSSQNTTIQEEKLKRFLYTSEYFGAFNTGRPEKNCRLSDPGILSWMKSSSDSFLKLLMTVNDDPLLIRRRNLYYITAEALHNNDLSVEVKLKIKETIFKLLKSDQEFFDFIKYYTLAMPQDKRLNNCLKKMVEKFYKAKQPKDMVDCLTKQQYHSWTHKNLIRLSHFKPGTTLIDSIVKYNLFGPKTLPGGSDREDQKDPESKYLFDYLKKSHQLRTTEDVSQAVSLIQELHADISQVNSKLNKNEEVWMAVLSEMGTREILTCLHRFYKFGFLKSGGNFQSEVTAELIKEEKIKKANLHPLEVFIYLKFFEKGGRTMDPKLAEYLQTKDINKETLKKLTTPPEPKCKPIIHSINKCLKISYNNVQPTGKRFMVTIDVTDKAEEFCFRNKRITFLEGAVAIVRFLSKIERSVTVAVFKDNQVNFVDISKYHSSIAKLKEHKAAYILPSAPIEWARNKKKPIDVFINIMGSKWLTSIPDEVSDKMEKLSDALNKYSKKMNAPETRVVKLFLGGSSEGNILNGKNIMSIVGFTTEVPRLLEAFCKGNFA